MSIGKKFPKFKLADKDGTIHSLDSLASKYYVIFFYPKDSTPGCTIESKGFSKLKKKFESLGATVIGISGGDEKTKAKFCKNNSLETLMLSDSEFKLSTELGIYTEKSFMGKKYMGISRVTYLLDAAGKIVKFYETVKPLGHPQEVLLEVEKLSKA